MSAVQLSLPLDSAPAIVQHHGLRAAHFAPMVGRLTGPDKQFWSGRVPHSYAWAYPYIRTDDAGATWATLTLDCDNRRDLIDLADLPPYNWIVWTPRGAHLTWCLSSPVGKHRAARPEPERYLSRVAEYYHAHVAADPAFNGMGRNPTNENQKTSWGATEPYGLQQLSSVIPFNWKRPKVAQTAVGRNVCLFQSGCKWAGRSENRGLAVLPALYSILPRVLDIHGEGHPPHVFADDEIAGIARSIERYREKWARHGWHAPAWIERQAARGRMGKGKPRQASLYDQLNNEDARPWQADGVSRRTWYRDRGRTAPKSTHGGARVSSGTKANTVNPPGEGAGRGNIPPGAVH